MKWTMPTGVEAGEIQRDFTFVFSVSGGNSVELNVHIGWAQVWGYADQPVRGQNDPVGPSDEVGHASWGISMDSKSIALLKKGASQEYSDLLDDYGNGMWGYWPTIGIDDDSDYDEQLNSEHDIRKGWTISRSEHTSVMNYTKDLDDAPPAWDLLSNNCVDAALGAIEAAGVEFEYTSNIIFNNVGDFGQALAAAGGEWSPW